MDVLMNHVFEFGAAIVTAVVFAIPALISARKNGKAKDVLIETLVGAIEKTATATTGSKSSKSPKYHVKKVMDAYIQEGKRSVKGRAAKFLARALKK